MSNGKVVWDADDGNGDMEIFLYDGQNIIQLTDNDVDDLAPDIDGNLIAWFRDGEGVYAFDGLTTQLVSPTPYMYGDHLEVSGNQVSWIGKWQTTSTDGVFVASIDSLPPNADFNGDGRVDIEDIDLLRAAAGSGDATFDMDDDGDVDDNDLAILVEDFVLWSRDGASGMGTAIGDFNLDGSVTAVDLALLQQHYGSTGGWGAGNSNCDDMVDVTDLLWLKVNYGTVVTASGGQVPEPATMGLLGLGGLTLLRRRKRCCAGEASR